MTRVALALLLAGCTTSDAGPVNVCFLAFCGNPITVTIDADVEAEKKRAAKPQPPRPAPSEN